MCNSICDCYIREFLYVLILTQWPKRWTISLRYVTRFVKTVLYVCAFNTCILPVPFTVWMIYILVLLTHIRKYVALTHWITIQCSSSHTFANINNYSIINITVLLNYNFIFTRVSTHDTTQYFVCQIPKFLMEIFISTRWDITYCLADCNSARVACSQLLVVTKQFESCRLFSLVSMTHVMRKCHNSVMWKCHVSRLV